MPGAILLYVILYAFTVEEKTGDTTVYADDILRYFQGTAGNRTLWEFGHLLWRPLGFFLWRAGHSALSPWFHGSAVLEITAVLFVLCFLSGMALVPLCYTLCRRLGIQNQHAWAITAGLLLSATVLNYTHSGSAYNPGLALNLGGQILLLDAAARRKHSTARAIASGVLLALSVAIWFPYVLSLPAAFLIGWFGGAAGRGRIRPLCISLVSTSAAGFILFAIGGWLAGITSLALLAEWISGSAHGVHQGRQFIRLPTGITRTFFYFGDDGLLVKRFVFGDPYAPVRWYDLLTAGLWKVVLTFASLTALCWSLVRRREGWSGLAVMITGFAPTLLFAVFLFETSEPARYETLYPALIAALCASLTLPTPAPNVRRWMAVFLAAMIAVNLYAFGWELRGAAAQASARVKLIQPRIENRGVAFLVSFRDPLSTYFQRDPFVAEYRQHSLPFFHVIEPGSDHVPTWRRDAACGVLQTWKKGGDAWLSVRLLASKPKPEWNWAEHDDDRVHWTDLPAFFRQFETDAATGEEDGFVRLAPTARNRDLLEDFCRRTR
jgi:hypothetical protein